ncbi:Six-hairpin glycosidase-like protein [Fusarium flagelliforme]|uniref:Six-hairpin glycosidase-like protein n=1 Tax=Fusarium flagelliforme TaxID=2675880 RepID=UPI001E8E15F3|nr:Six-hairpin glycosidase-like protein [Fusarium flagelliforme]KAH7182371.1 Six-hairpin glycosidase-like protein [Fusarium flagelliforme]
MDDDTDKSLHLHYVAPASSWSEALPIGNGRLGAMLYGRTSTELLQLNEDSVWYGGPQDRTPRDAYSNLSTLRQLIRDEKHKDAESLVREAFFATPASQRHYEPLGQCTIEFGHDEKDVSNYKRYLDLERSQCTTRYDYKGVSYRRDAIASFPNNVLAIRVQATEPTRFVIRLNRQSEVEYETNEYLDSIRAQDNYIILQATPGGKNSNRLALALGVSCKPGDGEFKVTGNSLIITATECVIAMGAHTTYRSYNPDASVLRDIKSALSESWDTLITRHRQDYTKLFGKTSLRMWPDASNIPTNERVQNNRDPGLIALYHNYSRYLLISSSRKSAKALPATLQGIWNPSFAPPWGSKFTININLQMNYWPAASCNLIECASPLIDLLERMAEKGKRTAKMMYNCRGWCAHHNTDIFADTDPQDRWMPATLWPLGGVWLCIDVIKMLIYQYDHMLHIRIAPILEGCVQFLLDFLIPSACGKYLVTCPSLSPENSFVTESGETGTFCEGSVMDMTIVRIALESFIWSTTILNKENPLQKDVMATLGKLPPFRINKSGVIQEWGLKDYKEAEPGHRHISHLFGLFPDDFISLDSNPALVEAAKKTLARRAEHGGGHTGWSRAWLLNLYARLRESQKCEEHMDLLLKTSTLPNLLCDHPPFQIDGNFGGCAGITECLVQSNLRPGETSQVVMIHLLPSLPSSWKNGKLSNIRVMGGWLVSMEWRDGELVEPLLVESTVNHAPDALVVFPNGRKVPVAKKRGQQKIPFRMHRRISTV